MVLVLTNKYGVSFELCSGEHNKVLDCLNKTINTFENNRVFLVKEDVYSYEFATIENGWECVLMVADGYANVCVN